MAGRNCCHRTTTNPAETALEQLTQPLESCTITACKASKGTRMSTPQTDEYGDRRWYNSEGELHREDGPAIEWADGTRSWYLNNQRHREDGPAMEWSDGTRSWYWNGLLHRELGPAIEHASGTHEWYWNGQPLTFEQWLDKAATPQHQTLLRLRWSS